MAFFYIYPRLLLIFPSFFYFYDIYVHDIAVVVAVADVVLLLAVFVLDTRQSYA